MSTTTVQRGAAAATAGGVLWALVPADFGLVNLTDSPRGTLSFVAVAASFWIVGVLSLALLLIGLAGLRAALGGAAGRLGTTGLAVSAVGLLAMLLGNGAEVATLTFAGSESDLGHAVFLVGFLVLIVGSLLLGITVFRRRTDRLARAGGLLLAVALPLGIGLAVLGGVLSPGTDIGFWAAITVPTGVAWALLGRAMVPGPVAPADLQAARS
jgi:hypothetical protein